MSININVNGMKYIGRSYAEQAELEKRCKNRLLKVREQSKEIAQEIRDKVRTAKDEELKKLQKIKERELNEWKRRRQSQIQNQIDCCIQDFGNAHIAAINASCEESESLREVREEQDLMAACRGRVAMLQEQRRREKEAEDRLQKKKRKQQKTIGIQADFLTQRGFSENIRKDCNINIDLTQANSGSDEENIPKFSSKPNLHKHQTDYNPQNYTSNSVDSSNTNDSDSAEEIDEKEDSMEFNQITNLLKQRMQEVYDAPTKKIAQQKVVEISSESSSDIEIISVPAEKLTPVKKPLVNKKDMKKSPQKGILKSKKSPTKLKTTTTTKKPTSSPKKSKANADENNRVRYVDFRNMYETSYVPKKDLVIRNEPTRSLNAMEEAQRQTHEIEMKKGKINEDILRELCEIRSKEALEKEKIRRDYDRLRIEMDELSKQEQELRSKSNVSKPLSRDQLIRQEENRQQKMNEAVEKALKKNVITCPPVAREKEKSHTQSSDVNVAASSLETQKNSDINNLIKVERLKDLLEKINHQKRLILNELEKGEEVPGPDLQRVMECLKKLEQEKASLDVENNEKLKKIEELNEREQQIREREIRLENRLRELFNKQQQKQKENSPTPPISASSSESSQETKKIIAPPVEIIIKVQSTKSPRKKKRTIRCLDTLSREPGKIYPKTPIKKKIPQEPLTSSENPTVINVQKPSQKSSNTASTNVEPARNEKSQKPSRSILKRTSTVEDNSSSTTSYRSIPDQLQNVVSSDIPNVPLVERRATSRKAHHKLNPALMHYITRLLGMNTNIGNQLNVDVSSVTTPGSSTINTSGNNSAIIVEPSFDADRIQKLQQFIDDNYSFLNEVNDTIESVQQEQINEKRMEGIWRDALNKKKPQSVVTSGERKSLERENRGVKDKSSGVASTSGSRVQQASASVSSKPSTRPVVSHQNPSTSRSTVGPVSSQPPQQLSSSRRDITQNDMIKVTKHLESSMLTNYAEYTANCRQRINELTRMMEQVRQEKLKLIENSLSSGEIVFTEYREIAQQKALSDQKDSPSQREDPPSEEINNILQKQTRPFGVSKDSGISILSRPVTSSDIRDSPDTRGISEENANTFQPIKTPKFKVTTTEGENETIKDISQMIRQQQKPQRPPLTLKSFSPQIEKQHEPHELSTIAEIETPTASKVNIVPEDANLPGVSNLHSFPDFDEYAGNIGEHHFTIKSFPELSDLKDALPDINLKTFVNPCDFDLEISKNNEDAQSDSSLMDVMEELKKRNIRETSLEIVENDEEFVRQIEKSTPTTTVKITQPQSPRRPPAQSRIIIKTPENANTETVQIEIQQTPTKRKHATMAAPPPDSPKSNDTLTGIQEIEKDFQGAGLSWAASLLKRSEEAKKQKSSSSSERLEIEIEMPETSSSSNSAGRPLDLREFLRRELMKKSQKDKFLSDESSLSSQFMRSLLNASSSTTSERPKSDSSQNAKLRTSTPVNMKSSDKLTTVGKTGGTSQQLFGLEAESVSTVRDSGASGSDKF